MHFKSNFMQKEKQKWCIEIKKVLQTLVDFCLLFNNHTQYFTVQMKCVQQTRSVSTKSWVACTNLCKMPRVGYKHTAHTTIWVHEICFLWVRNMSKISWVWEYKKGTRVRIWTRVPQVWCTVRVTLILKVQNPLYQ